MIRRAEVSLAVAIVCFAGAFAAADDAVENEAPLRFRRVYASAQAIAEWPRPAERYLPIEPAEFERLVEQARAEDTGVPRTTIARGEYSARLVGNVLVDGRAALTWEASASRESLWSVSPWGPAVERSAWSDGEPAVMGLRNGRENAVVGRPGQTLNLDWSLRGHRDLGGALKFDLVLPRSLETSFALELPAGVTPSFEHGIVTPPEKKAAKQVWRVALGGHHRTSVRIVPSDPISVRRRMPLARSATTYRFSPRGLDVSAEIRLEAQHDAVRQLEVLLDPGVRVVSARFGDVPLAWSVAPNKRGDTVVLDLEESWQGTGRVLRIEALAPFETGAAFALPRLQPQGVNWQEGSITLLVPAPLTVQRFVPVMARQSKGGPLPAPALGEVIELQCFAPTATAELTVARMSDPMQVAIGTTVGLSRGKATARLVADCEVLTGERFFLVADIAEPWTIDNVTAQPEGVLGDWSITSPDGKTRRLALQLTRALGPDRPVRIVVEAQAALPPDGPYRADEFTILRFQETTIDTRLLGLAASGSTRVKLDVRDELHSVSPEELDDQQRSLLSDPPPSLIVETAGDDEWSVTVEPQPAQVAAEITTTATIDDERVVEHYRVRCLPSGPIGRLHVQFSGLRIEPLQWQFGPELRGQVTIREILPGEQGTTVLPGGKTWELLFRRRTSEPIEFEVSRTTPLAEQLSLALLSVAEAVVERGTVVVRAAGDVPLAIAEQGLTPIAASDDLGPGAPIRAAYRSTNDRETVSELQSVTITRLEEKYPHRGGLVWSAHTDSRYDIDGSGTHRTTLHLENHGRPSLDTLLDEGKFVAAWIDGMRVELDGQHASLKLPASNRFPVVVIEHRTQDSALAALSARTVSRPRVDLPTIAERQTLWLPPGYELAGGRTSSEGSLGWLDRWAGPLHRPAGQPIFDPAAPLESLAVARLDDVPSVDAPLGGMLDHLGRRQSSSIRTWGALVAGLPSTAETNLPLVIDSVALAAAGVTPDTPLPRLNADRQFSPRQMAAMRLQRAGLVILAAPQTLVLTSREFAAVVRQQLDVLDPLATYAVDPGELQTRLDLRSPGDPRTLAVDVWRTQKDGPWPHDTVDDAAAPVGWRGLPLVAKNNGDSLYLVRAANMHVGGWTAFLFMAIVGAWRLRGRRDLLAALAVVFAVFALLLPAAVAPWASGALLGTLFSLVGSWLTPRLTTAPRAEVAPHTGSTLTRALTTGAILVGFVLGAAGVTAVLADEPRGDDAFWVFIPCDAEGKPTGDRYQVPARLDTELRRRAREGGSLDGDWLLTSADYEVTLTHDTMQGLAVATMTAEFDVHTFRESTEVQLPWDLADLATLPDTALVDGRYVSLDYRDGRLHCTMDEAGLSHVEIPLAPRHSTSGGEPAFTLALPRVPDAQLRVKAPIERPEIEVLGAIGPVTPATGDAPLTAVLGPTPRVTVRWAPAVETAGAMEVEELYWLQVRPGSATVSARLKVHGLTASARRIRLAVDPRLRLMPLAPDQPIVEVVAQPTGTDAAADAREMQLDIDRAAGSDFELQLSFLVTNTSGVGNVRLPRLEVLNGISTRRWLGVSIDPALDSEIEGGEKFKPVALGEFVGLWSGATSPPTLAYELPRGSTNWTLAIRPRQPQTTADQRVSVIVGQRWIDVALRADLTTSDGFSFQHTLVAPKGLIIDHVSLLSDGVQRASRWTQEPNGRIVVFLNAPVTGRQELVVRGRLTVGADGSGPLPIVRLADVPLEGTLIDVYRRASVDAKIEKPREMTQTRDPAADASFSEHARLVASLRADAATSTAGLRVTPNAVTARVVQVASLKRDGLSWLAEIDMLWTVSAGTLDVLRLEIPDDWTGPFTIVPAPAASEIVELPGQRRQLLIYPRESVGSTYRVSVSGPVSGDGSQAVRMSHVAPIGAEVEAYVRLPSHAGLQRVDWETSQLRPAELPVEFTTGSLVEAVATYRVMGPEPVARLRRVEAATSAQRVRLADVRWAWQGGDSYVAWVGFDLEPAGATSCVLQLPRTARLIELRVDGRTTTAQPLDQDRWTVDLALRQLPERIEVWYEGPASTGSWHSMPLVTPHLDGAPAEKVLWTIYGVPPHATQSGSATERLDAVAAELTRLAVITRQVDLPVDDVSALSSDELLPWFAAERERWLASRDRVRQLLTGAGSESNSAASELARLEQEFDQTAQRLGLAFTSDAANRFALESPGRLWDEAFADRGVPIEMLVTGSAAGPRVQLASHSDLAGRWLGAVLLVVVAGAGYLFRARLARLADGFERWPQVIGVLVGLAWWLWLSPSVVGLLIAIISIFAGLRPGLRDVREGATGIVRLTARSR